MRYIIFKNASFIFLLCASASLANAQQKANGFPNDAVWIKMMNDPNANYYEAVKAFNDYWKTHKKPADPEDRLTEKEDNDGDKEDHTVALSPEDKRLQIRMAYEVKRFENWMREEKPFVQDDGRILSAKERKEIWEKQQQQLNEQNKTNH